jgi:hypothetical protein
MSFATLSRAERWTGVKKNRENADKKIQEGPKYATSIGDEDSISEYRQKQLPSDELDPARRAEYTMTMTKELHTRVDTLSDVT